MDLFEFSDWVVKELAKRDAVIERLSARVLALEARTGAAGMDPKAINLDGRYTPREAGAFLGWSRQTVYSKIRAGILPADVLPGSHRMLIPGHAILDMLSRMRPHGESGKNGKKQIAREEVCS